MPPVGAPRSIDDAAVERLVAFLWERHQPTPRS